MSGQRPVFPRHCEALRQPCAEPYHCGQLCRAEGDRLKSTRAPARPTSQRWHQSPALPYAMTAFAAVIGFGVWINKIFY